MAATLLAGIACARAVNDAVPAPDPLGSATPCHGRSCARAICNAGAATRVRGRVLDPASRRPLYGVGVYIPNGDVTSAVHGARCNPCGRRKVDAASSTVTNVRGEFVLDDVPVGRVPLVVELGNWRRIAEVDVAACTDSFVLEDRTRLPRNAAEGEVPYVAVTTGAADALECLLRDVGIDEAEITGSDDKRGHVHLFRGNGGGGRKGGFVRDAAELWNDASALGRYDLVVLSCEGTETLANKGGAAAGARGAMAAYARAGGHVFATHLHSAWLQRSPDPELRAVAKWDAVEDPSDDYSVQTSFPKGDALATWLVDTGASTTRGHVRLDNVTFSAGTVVPPARAWIQRGTAGVRYLSFNTPLTASRSDACGRFVFADLHAFGLGGSDFPEGCPVVPALTPQQLALEFLLFDSFACVDDDSLPPTPPR